MKIMCVFNFRNADFLCLLVKLQVRAPEQYENQNQHVTKKKEIMRVTEETLTKSE